MFTFRGVVRTTAAAALLVLPCEAAASPRDAHTSSEPIPVTERLVRLEVPRGDVSVVAAPDDIVVVEPAGQGGGGCIAQNARVRRESTRLVVGLAEPDGCGHGWHVRVPARIALDVWADDGAVTVTGVHGGVRVTGRAGNVTVSVTAGVAEVVRHVGEVAITTNAPCVGEVDAHARVGSAELRIQGQRFDSPKAPGPGRSVSLRGRGADRVSGRVDVGSAVVDLAGGAVCAP